MTGDQMPPGEARVDPPARSRISTRKILVWGIAMVGAAAGIWVLLRTDDDPIGAILESWPRVLFAAGVYVFGMLVYSYSWARLFPTGRREMALGFLISQPIKYLPGGVAQPLSQIALGVETAGRAAPILVAFPVHVLINVVAAATLAAPLLLVADVPSWSRWMILLTPILWVVLDRRWMTSVLVYVGRVIPRFQVDDELPDQSSINAAFRLGLMAHGSMFLSFGILLAPAVPGWSIIELTFAFAIAWLVGYVVLIAPAGLGAREAALLAILNGSITVGATVGVTVVHRLMTMVLELGILVVAVVIGRQVFRRE